LRHLYEREIDHGYVFSSIDVHIQPTVDDCPSMISAASTVVSALTCIAYDNNRYYLGAGISDRQMADEIRRARGHAGPNCEYLFRLADGVRKHFPDYYDEHLFALERYVLDNDDARCYSEKTNEHNAVGIVSLRKKNEGDESASTPSVRWRHQHNLSIRFVE
jgi:cation transport regulator ChaC